MSPQLVLLMERGHLINRCLNMYHVSQRIWRNGTGVSSMGLTAKQKSQRSTAWLRVPEPKPITRGEVKARGAPPSTAPVRQSSPPVSPDLEFTLDDVDCSYWLTLSPCFYLSLISLCRNSGVAFLECSHYCITA